MAENCLAGIFEQKNLPGLTLGTVHGEKKTETDKLAEASVDLSVVFMNLTIII